MEEEDASGLPGAGHPVPPNLGMLQVGGGSQALPASLPTIVGGSYLAPPALLEGNGAAGFASSAAPPQTSAPAASSGKRLCLEAPPLGAAPSGVSDSKGGALEPSQVGE